MDPTNHPDWIGGNNLENWINLTDFGSEVEFLQGDWVGVLVAFTGNGDGSGDDPTAFFYEEGSGVVNPWVFAKFYGLCSGTSSNGGWHIRHWMVNFQLAVELEGGRGSVIGNINPLPTTVSEGYRFK